MRRSLLPKASMNIELEKGELLLAISRAAISASFGEPIPVDRSANWLQLPGASFVTIKMNGNLRGCIGTLEAYRSLSEDVWQNACGAAFRDPRFRPLSSNELPRIDIEVSVLSQPDRISFTDERHALSQLRPHIDGVIFQYGNKRSTFLPQVWEQLPDAVAFMAQLKQKAGVAADFWSPDITLQRYTVSKRREQPVSTIQGSHG